MERVVITGLGMVTPIGSGKTTFWEAIITGKSGIKPVTLFDTSNFPVNLGAEVTDFYPADHVKVLNPQKIGRASQMAIAASHMALEDSGLNLDSIEPHRKGCSMGTTSGEPLFVERYNDARKEGGFGAIPADIFPSYPCHVIPANIAAEFELQGPNLMIPTACAAGNYAIGHAFDLLRTGRTDVMLAGGADAFSRITYMGFARLGAIAPEKCQPFDKNRKGMIPGEGAAVIVLETLSAANNRGAHIYAEILGYGISCDSYHITAGHPEGDGAIRAMTSALKESRVDIDQVDYISAHGTGTPTNDRVESAAARRLFQSFAEKVPMSSIKSMIGHTMGAASAIEAACCSLALDTGVLPPTINFEEPDPECGLDYVPNEARQSNPKIVLNNAYAFGGNNASLCLAKI